MTFTQFFFIVLFYSALTVNEGATFEKVHHFQELVEDLQEQVWRGDQKLCLETTVSILRNVQNFTLLSIWAWDAMQTKPLGLLYGSQYELGNFDQCLDPPWSLDDNPQLRSQYCIADIQMEGSKLRKEVEVFNPYDSAHKYLHTPRTYNRELTSLTWGLCVPAFCDTESVRNILNVLLSRSHLHALTAAPRINVDPACQVAGEQHQYTFGFYMFFVFLISLVTVALVSSNFYKPKASSKPVKEEISINDVTRCFSLQENYKKLIKVETDEIVVLNGIRVLTAMLVVLIHHPLITAGGHIFNGNALDKMLQTQFRWITHLDLVVDTFLMMSGLLLVKSFVPKLGTKLENPLKQLFKRYVRLVPTFAVIVFYISAVFWHSGSGPIWPRLAQREVNACQKNWWLSLLMVNNYINYKEQCFVISWSIPSDYHFTIVGTILFHLYNRHRRLGTLIFVVLFFAALVLPGIRTYLNGYPLLILADIETLKDIRNNEAFNSLYIASHMRMAPYFIGMMFGYFLTVYKPIRYKKSIPLSWSIAGASLGVGLLLSILHFGTQDRSPLGAALCSSVNRPLWAIGVVIIVTCCLYGTVPIVTPFLCWDVFRPLSRLTYGVYLVHSVLYLRATFSARTPYVVDSSKVLIEGTGVLAFSYLISLSQWMLVETPAINLYSLYVNHKQPPSTELIRTNDINTQIKDSAIRKHE